LGFFLCRRVSKEHVMQKRWRHKLA
jgi:hypothetical protein